MLFFLTAFGLVSVSNVCCIITKRETLRRASKCLLMPLLLAAYLAGGGGGKFFLPVIALTLGWIGDILLIRKMERKTFLQLGLASFLAAHLCYTAVYAGILRAYSLTNAACAVNIPAIVIFTAPVIALGAVIFRLIKPTREMSIPVIVYMSALIAASFLGFQVFLLYPGVPGLLILSGCFNFMVSDTILAYYTFRKLKVSGSVLLISFYVLAQAEIIMGLLFL